MTRCPYCNCEVKENLIEAEDGCCPECGALLGVPGSSFDMDDDDEYKEEDLENVDDFDEDEDDDNYRSGDLDETLSNNDDEFEDDEFKDDEDDIDDDDEDDKGL